MMPIIPRDAANVLHIYLIDIMIIGWICTNKGAVPFPNLDLAVYVCRKHNKLVIIMEPVKGGNLATVNQYNEMRELLQYTDPSQSPASWTRRYAASPEGALPEYLSTANARKIAALANLYGRK